MVSPIRFSGMASGLDTESIIKNLMKAERIPIDNLKKKRQLEEWKRDALREMNSSLSDLRRELDGIRLKGNLDKKIAVSSNEAAVSARSIGRPGLSSYTLEVAMGTAGRPASVEYAYTPPPGGTNSPIGGTDSFSIEINGIKVPPDPDLLGGTDTIDGIITKINAQSGDTKVRATYFNNKIVFTSTEKSASISVKASEPNPLGISSTPKTDNPDPGTPTKVKINGIEHNVDGTTFTYDGIEFNIKQATASPLTVSIKQDTEGIFDKIKSFIGKYNEVIDKINGKLNEKKVKGYEPLTDEEKEALPEKTAEKMEEMAKKGIISGDAMLRSGLDQMRRALYMPITGNGVDIKFDTLTEIGITGSDKGQYAYMENGKLYIDETKLRENIEQNAEKVIQLFTQSIATENDSETERYNKTGLAQRLYNEVNALIKNVSTKVGDNLFGDDSPFVQNLKRIDKEIERKESRLKQVEDRYWKQFTAMEKAMQRANDQSGWFSQLMSKQG